MGTGRAANSRVLFGREFAELTTSLQTLQALAAKGFRPATLTIRRNGGKHHVSMTVTADDWAAYRWEVTEYASQAELQAALFQRWVDGLAAGTSTQPAFRPVSVSGASSLDGMDGHYVVLWVLDHFLREGYSWRYFVGPRSALKSWTSDYANLGFRPLSVTIVRDISGDDQAACVFVRDNIQPKQHVRMSTGLGTGDVGTWLAQQESSFFLPICVDVSGSADDHFAAISVRDPFAEGRKKATWFFGASASGDDVKALLGGSSESKGFFASPYVPAVFSEHGEGQWMFLLRELEVPHPEIVGVQGDKLPLQKGKADPFDDLMLAEMQAKIATSAALCVYYRGIPILRRGYTMAVQGYPVTTPFSRMRVASCSKPVSALAAMKAIDEAGLPPASEVEVFHAKYGLDYEVYLTPETKSAGLRSPTLQDLLTHSAGWWREGLPTGAMGLSAAVAKDGFLDLSGGDQTLVVTAWNQQGGGSQWKGWPMVERDFIRFLFAPKLWPGFPSADKKALQASLIGQMPPWDELRDHWVLDTWVDWPAGPGGIGAYFPGKRYSYSPIGYNLAAWFVEMITGFGTPLGESFTGFAAWVKSRVLDKLGLARSGRAHAARWEQRHDEVWYVADPDSEVLYWYARQGPKVVPEANDMDKTRLFGNPATDPGGVALFPEYQAPPYPLAPEKRLGQVPSPPAAEYAPEWATLEYNGGYPMDVRAADAGLAMAVDDLARFASSFDQLEYAVDGRVDRPDRKWFGELRDTDGEVLLSAARIDEMLNPVNEYYPDMTADSLINSRACGFGRGTVETTRANLIDNLWTIGALPMSVPKPALPAVPPKVGILSHSGGIQGTSAWYCHREDKLAVAFAFNGSYGSTSEFDKNLRWLANDLLY